MSLRCKVSGCDLDPCGICRRCGSEKEASHAWQEAERTRPCFKRQVCQTCEVEREQPDHEWDSTATGLKCTRCGFAI